MQSQAFYGSSLPSFPSLGLDGGLGLPTSFSTQNSLASQGSLQNVDPNSPEAFKQNIQLVQMHVARVQALARSALAGVQQAYHSSTNPAQTAADVVALKQSLYMLVELLRQTGVGALPLEYPPMPDSRSEEAILEEETKVVQGLYNRNKRIQDGASVVADFLSFTGIGDRESLGASQSLGSVARRG